MSRNIEMKDLYFESLQASVSERIYTPDAQIQERNKISVTGYWIEPEKKEKFALLITVAYLAQEISIPDQARELSTLSGKARVLFETDVFAGMDQQQAENLLEKSVLHLVQPMFEAAVNLKLKEILSNFDIQSQLSTASIRTLAPQAA